MKKAFFSIFKAFLSVKNYLSYESVPLRIQLQIIEIKVLSICHEFSPILIKLLYEHVKT